jgi:hypothetical protein
MPERLLEPQRQMDLKLMNPSPWPDERVLEMTVMDQGSSLYT